jgi:K(+)-stimulated pyrophosphate-energized sodium pump
LIVDNASDISGMGSDLFESYVGAIISAIILALSGTALNPTAGVLFPIVLSAIGILASLIGIMFVRGKENSNPASALNRGTYISGGIVLVFALVLSMGLFKSLNNGFAIAAGLLVGIAIGKLTELYTSSNHRYVQKIAANCETGPATAIISGIGTGMLSTVGPITIIVVGIIIAFNAAGLYGIALAAVGMLSTTGMVVAVDAFGPISENAGGIAEMSRLPKSVRAITDNLYTVGLSTTAIGKGFAIGSSALTAIALLVAYAQLAGLKSINLMNPMVMSGLFLGAVLPFFFASLTMGAVRKAALKNLILPGIISVAVPIAAGLLMGTAALGALLAGATVAGVILAIMMANAGGAWDNAKRYIENGHYGGKFSIAHEAAVVGDEVGNPLQDISGPSINILIKLMAIVALVFAPMLVAFGGSI